MTTERRRAQRIQKGLTVQYRNLDGSEPWDVAEARDFSELGFLLKSQDCFEADTRLCMRTRLPSNPFQIYELEGKVIASERYQVRIEIVSIDSETQESFRQYIAWYLSSFGPRC